MASSISDKWASLGSFMAHPSWAVFGQCFPGRDLVGHWFSNHSRCLYSFFYPYVQISIPEFSGECMNRSKAYVAVEAYLSGTCSQSANKFKAEVNKDCSSMTLSVDSHEEVTDEFEGVKLWWFLKERSAPQQGCYPPPLETKRDYRLTFHRRHRELVERDYLTHVLHQGREFCRRRRQRKLYTNSPSDRSYYHKSTVWSYVVFEHPSTFDTVAMDPAAKQELIDDLTTFRNGKDHYAKIGKAWKRGYLLYGPPGTGKSSMIAAIAKFLDYDVYDLEISSVKNNTELRKLFIETTGKSIIVIEDIDCSLDLTGKRKPDEKGNEGNEEDMNPKPPGMEKEKEKEKSRVTLSGLLNFIDGLWSACGGERIIIFTTNHVENLDPALIRRGRMDKHIEMSYCGFEAFKVLARNYLGVGDGDHPNLFGEVRRLMAEVEITPADVAENLMTISAEDDAESCLQRLVGALKEAGKGKRRAEERTNEIAPTVRRRLM